ncbi:MAG TPA: YceI family protein [Candidatus Bathyarchaeia archaeon]|nr:YceI family protein [Candidatus Bathyarchaeia archaeon]
MTKWTGIVLGMVAMLWPRAGWADERVLILEAAKTSVTFTVKATGHDIAGTLALGFGQIRFDTETGAASGEVTLDVRRSETGNSLRDWDMHKSVLETERFPVAVFRPSRIQGTLPPSGTCDLVLAGIVTFHGSEHVLNVPVRATVIGDSLTAEAAFDVPYVAWGLRNPSMLFLKVAPVVAVTVKTAASLRGEGGAR